MTSGVLREFTRAVFVSLRRRARSFGLRRRRLRCGAVTFVQRFGDALNLNVHFHTLALDGVYAAGDDNGPRFHVLPPPDDAEIRRVTAQIGRRLRRLLARRGLGEDGDPAEVDPLFEEQPFLAALSGASVRGRIATGRRAGQAVLRFGDRVDAEDTEGPLPDSPRCARIGGVSVNANVAVPARDRRRLERLCRYVGRPPLATERLSTLADGRLLYRLKRRWRDGTGHIVLEPLEMIEKLAALVPPPRFNLVRYHGVLAPAARERTRIVPQRQRVDENTPQRSCHLSANETGKPRRAHACERPEDRVASATRATVATASSSRSPGRSVDSMNRTGDRARQGRRYSWAELMRRVFAVDVLECPRCKGAMRILAAIHPPDASRAILECLGLPTRPPPLARPAPAPPGPDSERGLPWPA